ncbi:MAG: hypothetical protein J4G01_02650 [Dehalococcoidia bacterium]|nr:hypothetical protein [Dehalococcoidia bacterium]
MTQEILDDTPGTEMFPQYGLYYDMVCAEVAELTDAQLDYASDRWAWSEWSIRRNVSHVASMGFRWLLRRWADQDLASGLELPEGTDEIVASEGRWLDEARYPTIESVLDKLRDSLDMCQSILAKQTLASMRAVELPWNNDAQAMLMAEAHPSGRRIDPDHPDRALIDLEYTFRHMWFEKLTHLYNVQRLKRAQGLEVKVELPREGYWVLEGWDRSEP